MKVRISYTVDVDDNFRRALNYRYGSKGMASRAEIKQHFEQFGGTINDDLKHEYHQSHAKRLSK